MKKLLFGITGLTLGGAERVLVDTANKLCHKYDITIFTIYAKGELEKNLSDKVKLKSLYDISYKELSKLKKTLLPLKILLFQKSIYNKYVKKDYNIEISFLEGPITRLFSTKNNNVRKIAWIHNDISNVFGQGLKSKIKKYADKKVYGKYETLIFVSEDNLNRFEEIYSNLKNTNKKVIYNYIDRDNVLEKSKENMDITFDKNTINFLTVARLVEQKGIGRIIKVHKRLLDEGIKHKYYVIGDGPLKQELQRQIKELNVKDSFILLGQKSNPYPYVKNVDYFCLFSNFEGYGMVLEEAKILEKYIIITDTAAREAVKGYNKSLIVENSEEGIYEGLKNVLEYSKEKYELNKNGQAYDNSDILEEIIKLLDN